MNHLTALLVRQSRRILAKWDVRGIRPKGRGSIDQSPNADVQAAARQMRTAIRDQEQNSDLVEGVLQILETAVIGEHGIRPAPMAKNMSGKLLEDLNMELADLWSDWAFAPEVTERFDEATAQRLALRTWLRDGDVFNRHILMRQPPATHASMVPYRYELIEPDLVPIEMVDANRRILGGVEIDDWGRAVAIHIAKRSAQSVAQYAAGGWVGSTGNWAETNRIPIQQISWIAWTHRIGQIRGVSAFAPVVKRLQDVRDIDAAERRAATLNAMIALFIQREVGGGKSSNPMNSDNDNDGRFADFKEGMVFDGLEPGEEVKSPIQQRPNPEVMKFRDAQIRAMALALGVSASSLMRRYDGTYSSQRQELVEVSVGYRAMWRMWVNRMERPKWNMWIDAVMLRELVSLPKDIDMKSLYRPEFTPPSMPWIDPQKESEANANLVYAGLESREHVMRSRGRDPRSVWEQIEKEHKEMERMGFVPGQPPDTSVTAPMPKEEGMDGN